MIRRMLLWFTMLILVGSLTSAQDQPPTPDENTAYGSLELPDQLSRENPDTAAVWRYMTEEE